MYGLHLPRFPHTVLHTLFYWNTSYPPPCSTGILAIPHTQLHGRHFLLRTWLYWNTFYSTHYSFGRLPTKTMLYLEIFPYSTYPSIEMIHISQCSTQGYFSTAHTTLHEFFPLDSAPLRHIFLSHTVLYQGYFLLSPLLYLLLSTAYPAFFPTHTWLSSYSLPSYCPTPSTNHSTQNSSYATHSSTEHASYSTNCPTRTLSNPQSALWQVLPTPHGVLLECFLLHTQLYQYIPTSHTVLPRHIPRLTVSVSSGTLPPPHAALWVILPTTHATLHGYFHSTHTLLWMSYSPHCSATDTSYSTHWSNGTLLLHLPLYQEHILLKYCSTYILPNYQDTSHAIHLSNRVLLHILHQRLLPVPHTAVSRTPL